MSLYFQTGFNLLLKTDWSVGVFNVYMSFTATFSSMMVFLFFYILPCASTTDHLLFCLHLPSFRSSSSIHRLMVVRILLSIPSFLTERKVRQASCRLSVHLPASHLFLFVWVPIELYVVVKVEYSSLLQVPV